MVGGSSPSGHANAIPTSYSILVIYPGSKLERIIQDIDSGISTLQEVSIDLKEIPPPSGQDLMALRDHPWCKALVLLLDTYTVTLANLEMLISHACQVANPQRFHSKYVESLLDPSTPSEYWTKGVISQGVIDLAIELGLLTPTEGEFLLSRRVWDHGSFALKDLLPDLEAAIQLLSELSERLKGYL